ncbi:type 4a pilus biogenesis protein PilO [Comamonas kerstersii]|uniref:Type 4a pilus biogenesis protein PilO n=1 Tax=Comamonas kerstersii TaxID=225992 RepID=A0A6A1R7C2_9BURK|nr:type 4a pilus biogenesis protein PilO [Comamonas kerstersii]KAB0588762.1 type 4a pilus biogenesis protein PilO [Comamonas kerstersii]QTW19594.1 type 4a pilus biogenesis protein PilO [Comamonas kerstersii]HBW63184.1 pilus assembly protein PilO [Comamonas kerstersii]
MRKTKKYALQDLTTYAQNVQEQFKDLDPKDPSLWPVLPRIFLCAAIALMVLGGAWYFLLSSMEEDLNAERETETSLRSEYETKLLKAVSLDALKKQREQVQQYVQQLEKQLPSKSEMAALLSDINQAGLGRSLQFELFKPGAESVKDYYAELPITVKISGAFHDIGMFASDIAHLPRIVNLSNMSIGPKGNEGVLTLDATVYTYRYLDAEEVNANRKGKSK